MPDLVQGPYKRLLQKRLTDQVSLPPKGHPRGSRQAIVVAASVASLAGLATTGAMMGMTAMDLLQLAPVLAIVAALLARRYPGERLIVRLVGSPVRARGRARTPLAVEPRTQVAALVPRGGLLLARSLAVRPPPAAVRAS